MKRMVDGGIKMKQLHRQVWAVLLSILLLAGQMPAALADEAPAQGCAAHEAEKLPTVAATCAMTGLTEGSRCARCGEVLVAQVETEKLSHQPEVLPAVEATCTQPGLTEGSRCALCGEVLIPQLETEKL